MAYPRSPIARTSGATTCNTSSTLLVTRNSARLEVTLQNLDATNPVYLVFETVEATNPTATTSGLKLGPGASYTTQSFTGAIAGIATTAACSVNVTEF